MSSEKLNVDFGEAVNLELNELMLTTTRKAQNLKTLYEGMFELINKQKEVIREQDKIINELKGGKEL